MTPEQRRAHLVLHGQTLLDAWTARCKLHAEGHKFYDEGARLWNEGHKFYDEGRKLWIGAVKSEFGQACTMTWDDLDCILGCGERYTWIA